jgi:hypothetical protein
MKRDEAPEQKFSLEEMAADLVVDFDMSEVEPWLEAQRKVAKYIDYDRPDCEFFEMKGME